MKRILISFVLIFSLCSSLAYGENTLLSAKFWKTATVEDVNSSVANGADVSARKKTPAGFIGKIKSLLNPEEGS